MIFTSTRVKTTTLPTLKIGSHQTSKSSPSLTRIHTNPQEQTLRRFTSQHKKAYFNTRLTLHKIWLNQECRHHKAHKAFHTRKVFHKINTRVTSREGPKPRTQEIPQERGLYNKHKDFLKREDTMKHKSFLKREDFTNKNTRITPREMSLT